MKEHAVLIHLHHAWVVWALFACGILLHWLLNIWTKSKDAKEPMLAVFLGTWVPMLWRSFLCGLIFAAVWNYPDMIAQALKLIGHPITPDESSVLTWPMNNVLAGLYGLGLDSLLGYVPFLKTQLPQVG